MANKVLSRDVYKRQLLRSVIDRFIPEGITVIQQGEIVARSLKDYLRRHPEMERELSRGGQIEFLTTEKGGMFDKMAALFMQADVYKRQTYDIHGIKVS